MNTDPPTVHPEFDTGTRTWFVRGQEFEAPTLALLQEQLGPQVVIRDYYPLSRPIAAAFLERVLPPTLQPLEVLRPMRMGTVSAAARPPRLGRMRADGKPKIRIDRALLAQLWNEGLPKDDIAARLGTTRMSLDATVRVMRKRGCALEHRKSNHNLQRGDHHVE